MKGFVRTMILLLISGVAGLFFLKGPDGKPWLSLDSLKAPVIESLTAVGGKVQQSYGLAKLKVKVMLADGVEENGNTTVYKWRAEDGTWQYSDSPASAAEVEVLSIDPNTNLIPYSSSGAAATVVDRQQPSSKEGDLSEDLGPENMPNLLDDARKARALEESRHAEMDAAMDDY